MTARRMAKPQVRQAGQEPIGLRIQGFGGSAEDAKRRRRERTEQRCKLNFDYWVLARDRHSVEVIGTTRCDGWRE